jgi:hypothetical protein
MAIFTQYTGNSKCPSNLGFQNSYNNPFDGDPWTAAEFNSVIGTPRKRGRVPRPYGHGWKLVLHSNRVLPERV